jgi:predicted transcriptional regulator
VQELLTHLATQGGAVGVCLGLSYLFIRQLHKELREVENKRVEDNKAMVSKLLELNDKWNETINAQIEVSEAQKTLLADIKAQMERYPRR